MWHMRFKMRCIRTHFEAGGAPQPRPVVDRDGADEHLVDVDAWLGLLQVGQRRPHTFATSRAACLSESRSDVSAGSTA